MVSSQQNPHDYDPSYHIDQICDLFEQECRSGGEPRIEDFLDATEELYRERLFKELLSIEIWHLRRQGGNPVPEEYVRQFPNYRRLVEVCFNADANQNDTSLISDPCAEQDADKVESRAVLGASTNTGSRISAELSDFLRPRYELLEFIKEGGMGAVYRGRHKALDMQVALKVIKPECSTERFEREAQLLAKLQCAQIVRVHDYEVLPNGVPILAMEWVDGLDLGRLMHEYGGTIKEEYVLPWMIQVCSAMIATAAEGIIHRDLKPSNILIDRRYNARVADFGLARSQVAPDDISKTGQLMGTVHYMAPEQADDPRRVDTRADIYSFGATFYHVLTGTTPFHGGTAFSVMFKHKTEPLVSPKSRLLSITDRMSEIIEKCLAKSPNDRFPSFAALMKQIESVSQGASPWDIVDDPELNKYVEEYQLRRKSFLEAKHEDDISEVYCFPGGRQLTIEVGDIVNQYVDAIVSSDTFHLRMSSGVSNALRRAAGEEVYQEARQLAPIRPGRAIVTTGGRLFSRFIFHGATMDHNQVPSRDIISEIMSSCLYHAETHDVGSIAFPLLGTGAGQLSRKVCLDAMFRAASRALLRSATCVREIKIVVFPNNEQSTSQSDEFVSTELPWHPLIIDGYEFFNYSPEDALDSKGYYQTHHGRIVLLFTEIRSSAVGTLFEKEFFVECNRLIPLDDDLLSIIQKLDISMAKRNDKPHLGLCPTVTLASINTETHAVTIASNGHPAIFIRRSNGSVDRFDQTTNGHGLTFAENECAIVYSPHLAETSVVVSEDRTFTFERIKKIVTLSGSLGPKALGNVIVEDLLQNGVGQILENHGLLVFGRAATY